MRIKFKSSKVFVTLFIFCLMLVIWGFLIEPNFLIQREENVNNWPGPPLRIAFLSDLHAGAPFINEKYIENLVSKINAMSPDLVLIGGDLVINGVVGGQSIPFVKVASLLKMLKARLGVYSVLGNHDWWNDGEMIRSVLENHGIQVLDNKSKLLEVSSKFNFWLIGIGDEFTNHADADLAFSLVKNNAPKILFMHDPAAIFQVKRNFFLALAGHMHGGQVFIPGIGAIITPGNAPKSWADGWVDFKFGSLFVSKGLGTSILPVRFNAPPEFVILDLK